MEQFIKEVRDYAKLVKKHPSTVIQEGGKCGGKSWNLWLKDERTPTAKIMDRIRKYIKDNPPEGK